MSDNFESSLINLGELSKPATVMIEKISDAVGGVFKPYLLNMPNEADNIMSIGRVLLTKIGQELAPICGSRPVEGFFDYLVEQWKSQGYIIDGSTAPSEITEESPHSDDAEKAESNNQ